MSYLIESVLNCEEKNDLRGFISQLQGLSQKYLLRNDILQSFEEFCQGKKKPEQFQKSSRLGKLIYYTQEIILEEDSLCFIIRPKIARSDDREISQAMPISCPPATRMPLTLQITGFLQAKMESTI